MWHGCTKCLSCQPCMELGGDSSSFVLELVGVCRTSQNGDECGIKVGALLSTWILFASVCCLPNAPSYSERFKPCPFPANIIYDTFPTRIWPDTTHNLHNYYQILINIYLLYHTLFVWYHLLPSHDLTFLKGKTLSHSGHLHGNTLKVISMDDQ
jgi:hypothetical protein